VAHSQAQHEAQRTGIEPATQLCFANRQSTFAPVARGGVVVVARDHFGAHSYQANRVDWNFNVTFDGSSDVARMVADYSNVVSHPGLYAPVPSEWIHSTILRVGFVSDFTENEMLATSRLLSAELSDLHLPEFVCDSWWLWGGNVVLHLTPEENLTTLYTALLDCLRRVVGPDRTPVSSRGSFIPHITLAYTRTHDQETEIHDQLSKTNVIPARFSIDTVSLLRQWPTNGHYEWDVVEQIPISTARPNSTGG
jgi:2'-5' RNA ligase